MCAHISGPRVFLCAHRLFAAAQAQASAAFFVCVNLTRSSGSNIMARTPNKIFKLKHTIAENVTARPEDVLAAKRALHDLGFYEAPQWGLTDIPDSALFTGIRDFQRANGLREDGSMKPGGETEAMMLKAKGGSGGQGSYIWRTVGDGKVRSSHAERDGKTFSWDDPPEGGHPGKAYNCRCRAEERDCTTLWLKLREIDQELLTLSNRLKDVIKNIKNLKLKIEQNKANIKYLKDIEAALIAGSLASLAPHILAKIAGYSAEALAIKVGIEIRETEAELKANRAKLQPLEKELPILENKVRILKARKDIAEKAYDACIGK
ncbi:MAG: phage minor head protein [Alphaproteobacteria bacterium]